MMIKKTISIEGTGYNISDGKSMIRKLIDSQINNCKIQNLTDWVRDHNTNPLEKDEKIAKLEKAKNELLEFFTANGSIDKTAEITIHLEVALKDKSKSMVQEKELVA